MTEPLAVIERIDQPDGVRVRVLGEIDMSNVEPLHEQILEAFGTAETLWLDLSATRYVDSQGLRLLKRLSDTTAARSADFTVIAPPASIAGQVLAISRMGEYLRIVPG